MAVIKQAFAITRHDNDINSIDVCANHLASGSSDRTVRVFRIMNEGGSFDVTEINSSPFLGHELSVTCVRFHNPHILLSCSIDGCVFVWDIERIPSVITSIPHKNDAPLRALAVCLLSDSFAAGGDSGVIRLWKGTSIEDFEFRKDLFAGDGVVNTVSFTSDGRKLISGSSDGSIRLWDAEFSHDVPLAVEYWAHELGVTASDIQEIHADAEDVSKYILATGGRDDLVKMWEVCVSVAYEFCLKFTCVGHQRSVNGVKFNIKYSCLISVGDDKKVFIWDPETGSALHTFDPPHTRPGILSCAIEDDLIFTGASDRSIRGFIFNMPNTPSPSSQPEVKPKPFLHWSTVDVQQWIKDIGMEQYVQSFCDNRVNGFQLYHMDKNFLQNVLHITIPEHRGAILKALQILKAPRERPHEIEDGGTCPTEFLCPITKEIMRQPVVASDGFSYEKSALKQWFDQGNTRSPVTNVELLNFEIIPNYNLMSLIEKFNR